MEKLRTPWLRDLQKRKIVNPDGSLGPNSDLYIDDNGVLRLKIERLTWWKTPYKWFRQLVRWANWVTY
jgi:hypothetical protein